MLIKLNFFAKSRGSKELKYIVDSVFAGSKRKKIERAFLFVKIKSKQYSGYDLYTIRYETQLGILMVKLYFIERIFIYSIVTWATEFCRASK